MSIDWSSSLGPFFTVRRVLLGCVVFTLVGIASGLLGEARNGPVPFPLSFVGVILFLGVSGGACVGALLGMLCPRFLRLLAPMTKRVRDCPAGMTWDELLDSDRIEMPLRYERRWRMDRRVRVMYLALCLLVLGVDVVSYFAFQSDVDRSMADLGNTAVAPIHGARVGLPDEYR